MFYVFFRVWPQFNDSFDFHHFDSVPAAKLPDALNQYALDWLQKNRAEIRRRRDERFSPEQLTRLWQRQAVAAAPQVAKKKPRPRVMLAGPQTLPSMPDDAVGHCRRLELKNRRFIHGQPISLFSRIAGYAGWALEDAADAAVLDPPWRWFFCEANSKEAADAIVEALENNVIRKVAAELGVGVGVQFASCGYIDSSTITTAEEIEIETQISECGTDAMPSGRTSQFVIAKNIAPIAKQVCARVAEKFATAVPATAEAEVAAKSVVAAETPGQKAAADLMKQTASRLVGQVMPAIADLGQETENQQGESGGQTKPNAESSHKTDEKPNSRHDKDDTKDDTAKKRGKKPRPMNKEAVDCVRRFKDARKADPSTTIISTVEGYVEENGGSVGGLMRRLNDNPDQWKK